MTKTGGEIHFAETKYGFEYGAAAVERTWNQDGSVCVSVRRRTGPQPYRQQVSVVVSPKGNSIRVFRGMKEMR